MDKAALHSFYDRLVNAYTLAADLAARCPHNNVYRGRQHAISSIAEDLFAVLLRS